jgi:hypothetical protein
MRLGIFLLAVFVCCVVQGQKKYRFHSQNYLGILVGEAPTALQIHTINGLNRSNWFGGIGVGMDEYFIRSVPLFTSLTKYINLQGDSFFFTIDGGTNFALDGSTGNAYNGYRNNGDFSPGIFYGGSAGYRFGIKNQKGAFLLNVGYTAKHLKESLGSPLPCTFPPCFETASDYHYKFNRLSMRLGWSF